MLLGIFMVFPEHFHQFQTFQIAVKSFQVAYTHQVKIVTRKCQLSAQFWGISQLSVIFLSICQLPVNPIQTLLKGQGILNNH